MVKYKIGDKVRVRKDLSWKERYYMENSASGYMPNEEMVKRAGSVVTIKSISSTAYFIEEDGWYWTDEMFEEGLADEMEIETSKTKEIKLEGNMKFRIKSYKVIKDKVVIVEFEDGDIQKSVCMPGDTFDVERGLEVCIMKYICGGKAKYHNVLKEAQKQIDALEIKAQKEKAEKENAAKKKAKEDARQTARKARAKQARIDEMTEAYLKALQKYNGNISIETGLEDIDKTETK